MRQLTLDFLAYLELERGLSRNTLDAYQSDLAQLGGFLTRRAVSPLDARHSDLAAFLSELAAGDGENRPPCRPQRFSARWRVYARFTVTCDAKA